MKKIHLLYATILVMGMLVFSKNTEAITFPNPDPSTFGDDLDDIGLFSPTDPVMSIEFWDLGAIFGTGNTFGFFFQGADVSDPNNLITIFDPSDNQLLSPQAALIDFTSNAVLDIDAAGTPQALQDTFTGSGNIGFFLTPDPVFGLPTLFSVPSLNGGLDFVGTYPVLGDPDNDFLIGFFVDFPPSDGILETLAFELNYGIAPVPEPSTFLLIGSGLLAFLGFRRRCKGEKSVP